MELPPTSQPSVTQPVTRNEVMCIAFVWPESLCWCVFSWKVKIKTLLIFILSLSIKFSWIILHFLGRRRDDVMRLKAKRKNIRKKEISKVNCRHVFVIFISIKVKSLFWGAKENKIDWKENNYILGFKNKPSWVQPSAAPFYRKGYTHWHIATRHSSHTNSRTQRTDIRNTK